jgi:putative hemolysin
MNDLALTLFTLLAAAFFSGLEIAFLSANRLRIELDKNKGILTGRILSAFTRHPSRFLGTILLGNSISLVVYGMAMSSILEPLVIRFLPGYLHTHLFVLITQTLVATPIILFFAEFLPKILFRINPNVTLNAFAIPAFLIFILFYPLIWSLTEISEFIIRKIVRKPLPREKYLFTPLDLDNYLREFSMDTRIEQEEEQEIRMLHNVLGFRDVVVRECMVPRPEMVVMDEKEPIRTLREKYIDTGLSRIPIYRGTIDNIIGYTYAKDLFANPSAIGPILIPVTFVPETMPATTLLNQFIGQNRSIAIVVDEFGGTSGLVTMEDIIEEIIGEIGDEFDVDKMTDKKIGDHEYVFSGRLEIDYLNDKYQLDLPESDEYETVAGLIIHFHESIPRVGEVIRAGRYQFTVQQASGNRIEKVGMVINPE